MSAADLIDLRKFAAELRDRRNKAALLLTPDILGQRAYSIRLAAATGGFHLDVLDRFREDESLTARLAVFSMDDLLSLFAQHKNQRLIVASGIEFLLGAWLGQGEPKRVKHSLCQKVELWERQPAILLVTQHDATLADYRPERYRGGPVVLETSQTLALE